ncbi:hypothetical protein VP1G_04215 [Cytospora mali]|uniref:Uncharacterized protein n=1 Tax=Cytospora mali TaxID=578113 RepID=A0A194UZ16_CYTMA|nr:hypothetical protein VP1G_04215 [Valsa mali var. pyri (nom. inval.)]
MADILEGLISLGDALFQHPDPTERKFASEILRVLFQNHSLQERDDYAPTVSSFPQNEEPEKRVGDCVLLSLAKTLNAMSPGGSQEPLEKRTPLSLLQAMVKSFFTFGPDIASRLFSKLHIAIRFDSYEFTPSSRVKIGTLVQLPSFNVKDFPWNSCKVAASLVLLLAAHATKESLYSALKSQSWSMGGLPTRELLSSSSSDSLLVEFQRARRAALEEKKTTVMGVKLIDKHIFDLEGRGVSETYFSFAHSFAMGVGPEGIVVWQGFGKHGYRLDQYIRDGHARVRSWDEAKQFVSNFEKLVSAKGIWSAKINKLYKKLFLVDINSLCSAGGPERPVTPRFRAHVSIHCINDVQCQDVTKFLWDANAKWSL